MTCSRRSKGKSRFWMRERRAGDEEFPAVTMKDSRNTRLKDKDLEYVMNLFQRLQ